MIRYVHLGNPVEAHFVQIGIVQGGVGKCGSRDFPSIYVRLEQEDVYDFINEAMSKSLTSVSVMMVHYL